MHDATLLYSYYSIFNSYYKDTKQVLRVEKAYNDFRKFVPLSEQKEKHRADYDEIQSIIDKNDKKMADLKNQQSQQERSQNEEENLQKSRDKKYQEFIEQLPPREQGNARQQLEVVGNVFGKAKGTTPMRHIVELWAEADNENKSKVDTNGKTYLHDNKVKNYVYDYYNFLRNDNGNQNEESQEQKNQIPDLPKWKEPVITMKKEKVIPGVRNPVVTQTYRSLKTDKLLAEEVINLDTGEVYERTIYDNVEPQAKRSQSEDAFSNEQEAKAQANSTQETPDWGSSEEAISELEKVLGKKRKSKNNEIKTKVESIDNPLYESMAKYDDQFDDLVKELKSELSKIRSCA